MPTIDDAMREFIEYKLGFFAKSHFSGCDVIAYYGQIIYFSADLFKAELEELTLKNTEWQNNHKNLVIILNTHGGSVESVEKMVDMSRRFYKEVYFVVPNIAMSAGTIWCMSGDKIYMDYASSLGPIDPQVQNQEGRWVPALGYLDKCQDMIDKSKNGTLSFAELEILKNQDLGMLRQFEQAKELSIALLKKWLVTYKFKDWKMAETRQVAVTDKEKEDRAEKIASDLSNNSLWLSHSRMIGLKTLREELNLRIEDYTENDVFLEDIREVHQLVDEFVYKLKQFTKTDQIVVVKSRQVK